MGLLDDAIREHLELKRRHGADVEEVSRLEAEALGPARREPPAPAGFEDPEASSYAEARVPDDVPAAPADAGYDETAYDDDVEADYDAHGGYEEELHEPPLGEEPEELEPRAPAPAPAAERPSAPAEPAAFTDAPRPVPDRLAGDPDAGATREWDVEAELRRDEEPVAEEAAWLEDDDAAPAEGDDREGDEREDEASEDVLEETPDFLQETPEHDRLWFEQRPPRDFDFDG
jgi:hypothetical protein